MAIPHDKLASSAIRGIEAGQALVVAAIALRHFDLYPLPDCSIPALSLKHDSIDKLLACMRYCTAEHSDHILALQFLKANIALLLPVEATSGHVGTQDASDHTHGNDASIRKQTSREESEFARAVALHNSDDKYGAVEGRIYDMTDQLFSDCGVHKVISRKICGAVIKFNCVRAFTSVTHSGFSRSTCYRLCTQATASPGKRVSRTSTGDKRSSCQS
jgi:hypothetical protein